MNNVDRLITKLTEFIALEGNTPRADIASFIVGELIGNPDGKYDGLEANNPTIARIADLASDLEWSNGSEAELERMWHELTTLISNLSK